MYAGMRDGDFTSKRLSTYFTATVDDPVNARRIINGTDRAETVAGYHRKFLEAFNAAYVEAAPEAPAPEPTPEPETPVTVISLEDFEAFMADVNRLADALVNKGNV
jgi:putative chitinase